ncbi:MAG: DUF4234 domain-containing protein [Candidatus Woesearchaeota archaeon]
MSYEKLVDYIVKEYYDGYTLESLRNYILKNGYNKEQINSAMNDAKKRIQSKSSNDQNSFVDKKFSFIKKRNPVLVLLFSIFSLGIYYFYWLNKTSKELTKATDVKINTKLLLLLIIPGLNVIIYFLIYWKYTEALDKISDIDQSILLLLLIFFSPLGIFISQLELNKVVEK